MLTKARAGQIDESIRLLDSIEAEWGSTPALRALRGLLLLGSDRLEEGRTMLSVLRTSLASAQDPKEIYIRHFCQSHLAWLQGDPFKAHYEARMTEALNVPGSYRRHLWMYNRPEDDENETIEQLLSSAFTKK